mmetsp:Transcript_8377/g.16629  ORF Transcript_8377/g.16629 Transcript_8377/m.16629 type:complete len:520 (+) Transcript_8377:164-1723(+)
MELHLSYRRAHLITLRKSPECLIREIKQDVQTRFGFPVDDSSLVYAGRNLDNRRSLQYYNLSSGDTLILVVRTRNANYSVNYNGDNLTVELPVGSKVLDLKATLARNLQQRLDSLSIIYDGDMLGEGDQLSDDHARVGLFLLVMPTKVTLNVMNLNRSEILAFDIELGSNIRKLREYLVEQYGFPALESFCLVQGSEVLGDSKRLDDIRSTETILSKPIIEGVVSVRGKDQTYNVVWATHEPVSMLKSRILTRTNIRIERQRLLYKGTIMMDESYSDDYKINLLRCEVILIELQSAYSISVVYNDYSYRLTISESDTVVTIKAMMSSLLEGVGYDKMKLIKAESELSDLDILSYSGVHSGCTLNLLIADKWVMVHIHRTASRFAVGYSGEENVEDLKRKIAEKFKIAQNTLVLKYEGRELSDRIFRMFSAGSLIVALEEVVNIDMYLVDVWRSDERHMFSLPLDSNVSDLRQQLARKLAIPETQIQLYFKERRLVCAESKTLSDYQIEDEAEIKYLVER